MNVTDEPPNTTMNLHALKTPTAQETLESLCTEISRLKREESALSTKRQSIENAVIAIVGDKEEGAKTVALADGRKLTVTGKLTYSADMAQLLSLVTALPEHLSPIKLVHQLDATGAKWLRANDPENWAKIAPAITVKPAKTAVEVK